LSTVNKAGWVVGGHPAFAPQRAGGLNNVEVVGLGAGSLVCYAKPGENWTFFEIDPEVVRLARNPSVFRYLSRCTRGRRSFSAMRG
jgi:hypothetical protein